MNYLMIVHNDLDGTASAAVYSRLVNQLPKKVIYTEPNFLPNILMNINESNFEKIVIADLGINESNFEKIVKTSRKLSKKFKIEWYDHHIWKEEWKRVLEENGVEVHHDITTCGAGVIYKSFNVEDMVSKKLVSADCSVDLWLHNDPLGEKLRRIIELDKDIRWKNYLLNKFYNGILWDKELEVKLEKIMDEELENYNKLAKFVKILQYENIRIVVAARWKGRPDISYASQYLMSKFGADIFVSANGKYVSFRSNNYDIRSYAVKLGGGGHMKAAGAPLKVPLIYRLLYKLNIKRPFLNYVSDRILEVIKEVGIKNA
ncbi:MAG: DHH family phosphoesterase [Sulfolobaceae archaeon]